MIYDLAHGQVALLVIDVQRDYFTPGSPAEVPSAATIVPAINRLIGAFRTARKPVVFIRHANRADGSDAGRMIDFVPGGEVDAFIEGSAGAEFDPSLDYRPGDLVVTKRRYDSFAGTELDAVLRTAGVRTIVIVGLMTSFCCETTARAGHSRDYEVVFVSDANEGPDLAAPDGSVVAHTAVLDATIVALSAGFADVMSTDDVLARLQRHTSPVSTTEAS